MASMNGVSPNPVNYLMRPDRRVGIVGYGAYVPRFRLPGSEVARVWTGGVGGSPVTEKAVAGPDEDVTTMRIEAARNALARAGIDPTGPACGVDRQREPPLCRQADQHHRRGEYWRVAQHPGRRLGVRLQGRHRSSPGFDRHRRQRHGPVHAEHWDGHRPVAARRRARIHGGQWRRGLRHRPGGRVGRRLSRAATASSPTRRTSGGAPTRAIPVTASASPANRLTSTMSSPPAAS